MNMEKNNTENREYSELFSRLIKIQEGTAEIYSFPPEESSNTGKALSKNMPVFYNPIQEINRSLSILVYSSFLEDYRLEEKEECFTFCDSMAASGIRSIRMGQFIKKPIHYILYFSQ